ncbi:MAG: hypothetical protein Q9N26_08555 [Aquificota bacterium]|nr:hypothetical protein [Aquificota bacterium]
MSNLIRLIFLCVVGFYGFVLLSSYFSYIEPYLFPLRMMQGNARYVTENIIIGPYPHESDIKKLIKVEKVRVFISILNPDLPFEGSLVEKEKEVVSRYGAVFYNVPMGYIRLESPENYRQIRKIREIVRKHAGEKIYIHCYLGRHRVGFVAENLIGLVK